MIGASQLAISALGVSCLLLVWRKPLGRLLRAKRYFRGRSVSKPRRVTRPLGSDTGDGLVWGDALLPAAAATRHFLVAGTTGSGKTHVQRLLLQTPLLRLGPGTDSRVLAYDAKGDTTAYLKQIGVTAPVYSLNPFESRSEFPRAVGWDAGGDITSPMRALNLAAALVPKEGGGNNLFFTNASRHVAAGVLKSLLRHNAGAWSFSDFIAISLNRSLTKQVLGRDAAGRRVVETYLRDDRTGDDVYSTLCTHLSYFEPVAALWRGLPRKLSLREWLGTSSVLLLGHDATASAALDVLNEQLFRLFADEVDTQTNSSSRRTWVWLEEAREAKGIIGSEALQQLANKGRSRGVCLVVAFQAVEGLYSAAGKEQAENLVSQCSHKCLLRLESPASARWASDLLGQHETIEVFRSDGDRILAGESRSEQRVQKDAVLPSEFYALPETSASQGLTGYFARPNDQPRRVWVSPHVIERVVVSDSNERAHAVVARAESDQWLPELTSDDADRLGIEFERSVDAEPARSPAKRLRLRSVVGKPEAAVTDQQALAEALLPNR